MAVDLYDIDDLSLFLDANYAVQNVDGATTNSSDDTSAARKKRDAEKRRESRQREKSAREALKRQERELSHELTALKQAKKRDYEQALAKRSPMYYVWKTFATRQLEGRLQAEAEQRQLSVVVSTQHAYIQQLSGALRQRIENKPTQAVDLTGMKRSLSPTEAELCHVYLKELGVLYTTVDDVLSTCGFSSMLDTQITARSVRKRESDGEVEYYQKLTRTVQPSSLSQTDTFMWKSADVKKSERMKRVQHFHMEDPNTKVFYFNEEVVLCDGAAVPLLQRCYVRRYAEPNRTIALWKMITEGEGAYSGVYLIQDGVCCMRPSADATTVELCQRWSPVRFESTPFVGKLHQAFQHVVDGTIKQLISSVEKQLLDDAINSVGW